jgi:putative redox protein
VGHVTVRSLGGFQQQVFAPPHSFVADEPEDYGGDNVGVDPYELLLASLGACTNMTLIMYAQRKGWDLQGVETRLNNDRVYGEDCRRCEEDDGYMDVLTREITLRGDLAPDQVATLTRVAGKCPVHKTLTRGLIVEDSVRVA